jgi:hypothetical protein
MVYKPASYLQKQLLRQQQRNKNILNHLKNNCMKGKYITTQILIACGGKKRNQAMAVAA